MYLQARKEMKKKDIEEQLTRSIEITKTVLGRTNTDLHRAEQAGFMPDIQILEGSPDEMNRGDYEDPNHESQCVNLQSHTSQIGISKHDSHHSSITNHHTGSDPLLASLGNRSKKYSLADLNKNSHFTSQNEQEPTHKIAEV